VRRSRTKRIGRENSVENRRGRGEDAVGGGERGRETEGEGGRNRGVDER